jgi:hypothetical protein
VTANREPSSADHFSPGHPGVDRHEWNAVLLVTFESRRPHQREPQAVGGGRRPYYVPGAAAHLFSPQRSIVSPPTVPSCVTKGGTALATFSQPEFQCPTSGIPTPHQRSYSAGRRFPFVAATTSPGQARILDKASRTSRLAHPPFAFQFSPVTSVTWVRLRPFSRASTRLRSWLPIRFALCH